jgi:hypothetical protein
MIVIVIVGPGQALSGSGFSLFQILSVASTPSSLHNDNPCGASSFFQFGSFAGFASVRITESATPAPNNTKYNLIQNQNQNQNQKKLPTASENGRYVFQLRPAQPDP